jgi:hypothetical protein
VPYVNIVRRLGARRIRRANERVRAAGGTFYQFAFSRHEAMAMLERNGFRVLTATPYDPGRLLHRAWRRLRAAFRSTEAATSPGRVAEPSQPRRRPLTMAVRRLLYTPPMLHALGHMILVVAVKR